MKNVTAVRVGVACVNCKAGAFGCVCPSHAPSRERAWREPGSELLGRIGRGTTTSVLKCKTLRTGQLEEYRKQIMRKGTVGDVPSYHQWSNRIRMVF